MNYEDGELNLCVVVGWEVLLAHSHEPAMVKPGALILGGRIEGILHHFKL